MAQKALIIINTHIPYRMPEDPLYLPVQVGAEGKGSIGYQPDNEGDNISRLNPYFCELTGIYWAWKNLDADYIGASQYRRYFSFHPHRKDPWQAILTAEELAPFLGRIKVFVPGKRRYYIETLYTHYAHTHYIIHLDRSRSIIGQKYPDFLDSFDQAVQQRWGYMFNMMIMEKEWFHAYCAWLFDILFELRAQLGEDGLSPYNSRYYGRVSEILFNVWLRQQLKSGMLQNTQVLEIPYLHMEKVNWIKKGSAFLLAKYAGRKYEESF